MLLFLLFAAVGASAQSQVFVDTSPKSPIVGERWIISLLVDHGVPDEVIISAPVFGRVDDVISSADDDDLSAPSLFMDSFSKAPRRAGGKQQTAIEYRFIPSAAGAFYFEPFIVTTPGGVTKTEPIILEIRKTGADKIEKQVIKTFWEGAPAKMAAGENAVFTLRLLSARSGANSAAANSAVGSTQIQQLPPQFFMPQVPPGVILASLPISAGEREGGIVLKLNLVPLSGSLRLSARTIQHENLSFEIPALFVSTVENDKVAELERGQVPFENGDRYPAAELAELRRSERDHLNGKQFSYIRRAAEESGGIFGTKDESRWRRNLLLGLVFFIIFLVIVSPFACLMFVRNTFRRRAAFFCAVVFAALSSIYFYFFADTSKVFKWTDGRSAVTLATTARKTADEDGEELYSFKEGQPVEVLLKSDSWLYVRTFDSAGGTGWIPAEKAIFY